MFVYEKDKALLIAGFGNPLIGDDAAGIEVIRRLSRIRLPSNIELYDGGNKGIDLIFLMEKYEQIIVVDSVVLYGETANESTDRVLEFGLNNIISKEDNYLSLHNFNLNAIINLMQSLKLPIPRILFLGIKAININYGTDLTNKVKQGIDLVIHKIKGIINYSNLHYIE